ncbi:MAG: [NiFe]-hydrogenase assembly chaperone HybE [Chromatiales bacterium]|nr:[NiFe]-hydrogenase assembly chaperone HybE [Chromatiales bacterium]
MDVQTLCVELERVFNRIHQERMQGIPILNPEVKVQAVGFQIWGDSYLGVMVTPWFMNLMLIPQNRADNPLPELGEQVIRKLPSQEYKFTVNEIEELGPCLTHALYSPMSKFPDHTTAVQTAEAFLATLMDESVEQIDNIDEARMARYLNGEEMEQIRLAEEAEKQAAEITPESAEPKQISRRDLIRGAFLGNS